MTHRFPHDEAGLEGPASSVRATDEAGDERHAHPPRHFTNLYAGAYGALVDRDDAVGWEGGHDEYTELGTSGNEVGVGRTAGWIPALILAVLFAVR
jgi:hypothetical protein